MNIENWINCENTPNYINEANLNGLKGVVSVTAKSPFCAASGAGEATGQEQKNGGNMCHVFSMFQ